MKTEITAILEMMAEYMKRVSDTSTNYEQLIESFSQRLNVHTSHSQITNDLGNLLTDLASMTLHQDWSPLGWLWRQEVVVWGGTCDICRTPDSRKWTLKGSWGHLYTVDYVHHYSVGALNHSTLKSPLIGNRNKFLFCQMTPSLCPPYLTRQIRGREGKLNIRAGDIFMNTELTERRASPLTAVNPDSISAGRVYY